MKSLQVPGSVLIGITGGPYSLGRSFTLKHISTSITGPAGLHTRQLHVQFLFTRTVVPIRYTTLSAYVEGEGANVMAHQKPGAACRARTAVEAQRIRASTRARTRIGWGHIAVCVNPT